MNRAKRAIPYFHHSLRVSLTVLALLVITACSVTIPGNTVPPTENIVPPTENTVPPTERTTPPTETSEPEQSPTVVELINYEQIKIWNWGNPEFYLTYDPADWDTAEYFSLVSKTLSDCHISANGYRDGGPEGPPPYTYATDTKIMDGIEYFIDIEIPNATGIPDMFHIYWDKQNETYQYAVALFPGPVGFDECVAGFWEVMQLSAANGFALETIP